MDTYFEKTIFVAIPIIGEDLKQIDKLHGLSLNHWVGGIMHITFQTRYDIQYLIMLLDGYMNAPIEPDFISLKNYMEYIMHHTHEPIMYSRKKIYKNHESPHQYFPKQGMKKSTKIWNIPTSSTHIVM